MSSKLKLKDKENEMKNIFAILLIVLVATQLFAADKAADFKLENLAGKQVKLSDLQENGLVIIDFWATWCTPCKKSLPKMNELHEKYDDVTVIAICTDKPRKKAEAVSHIKSNKFSFHTLFDPKKVVQKQFNVNSIPHALIIDQDGTILYEHTGYQRGDEKHFEEIILKWQEKKKVQKTE